MNTTREAIEIVRFGTEELRNLSEVVASGVLDDRHRRGRFNRRFEELFRNWLGVPYACTVASATAGLDLALMALGIGRGDEVAVDPLVKFGAVATLHCGATPVWIDVDPRSFLLDPDSLRRRVRPNLRAVICTALFGHVPDLSHIVAVARAHGVAIIEDCSQAIGAWRDGVLAGTTGDFGVFSFQATKHVSTGDGGMVVTWDERLYDQVIQLREHGWHPNPAARVGRVGWNHRMTELSAAVGVAQFGKLERILDYHRAAAALLTESTRGSAQLQVQSTSGVSRPSFWKWAAAFPPQRFDEVRAELARVRSSLKLGLYPAGPAYNRPAMAHARPSDGGCPIAERLAANVLVMNLDCVTPLQSIDREAETLAGVIDRLAL